MDCLWNPWTHKRLNQTAEKGTWTQESMDSVHGFHGIHGLTDFGIEHNILFSPWNPWIPDGIDTSVINIYIYIFNDESNIQVYNKYSTYEGFKMEGKGVGMVDRDKGVRKRKGGRTYLASLSFSS